LYPVLFRLGRFTLTGYAALVDIGLVLGALIACLVARHRGLRPSQALDAALAAAVCGIIAGRAVYVAAHWDYFESHVGRALRPWDGGLSWHGALVGGLIGVAVYCALRRASLCSILNVLAPSVAVLTALVWCGCLLDGCAFGMETYPGQRLLWALSMDLPNGYGIHAPRVAVQLLGAGWSAIVFIVIIAAGRDPRFQKTTFPLWLALYCAGSFGLGFVRADAVPLVGGWRADQVADLALAGVGVVILLIARRRHR
jgi:phosphatidylglycerol:prolipoprotein diacylglycerol transferase